MNLLVKCFLMSLMNILMINMIHLIKLYSHNEKEEYHDCDTDSNIV